MDTATDHPGQRRKEIRVIRHQRPLIVAAPDIPLLQMNGKSLEPKILIDTLLHAIVGRENQ